MVAGTQVVRLPSGGSVQVKSGIIRGVGPAGPLGPAGAKGDKGDAGPQGPIGEINDLRSYLSGSGAVAVAADQWYDIGVTQTAQQDLLIASGSPYSIQFSELGSYIGVAVVRFEPTFGSGSSGTAGKSRSIRLADSAGNQFGDAYVAVAAAPSEPTIVIMIAVLDPDPSKIYKLQAQADDTAATNVGARSLTLLRVGAGPAGPAGPSGPIGTTGSQGPQGPTGDAGTGYTTFNAIIDAADATAEPSGDTYNNTDDQGLEIPAGTNLPAIPYFMQRLAVDLEPLLVARYASTADRTAKRSSRSPGEVTYLEDTGTPQLREKNGADLNIARVILSNTTPPSGAGQAAPGVIWIQQ